MYADAYLLDEQAAHIQREHAAAASHARLVRRTRHAVRPSAPVASLVERVTAAFRPAPEPCTTS
jgi:hypothetical protein